MFEGGDYEDDDDSFSDYETNIDVNGDDAALNEQMFGKAPDLSKLGPGHIAYSKKRASPQGKMEDAVSKAQSVQLVEDIFSKTVLCFLTDLLPSLERRTDFDSNPPHAVLEMLNNSRILQYCAELLRNDSLADVTKRKDLYQTLFSFLTVVGSHHSTKVALFGPRFVRSETMDLLTLSFSEGVPDIKDRVSTLAECLRNLTTQSSMVLQSVERNEEDFENEEGREMLRVCHQISDLAKFIQTNMAIKTDSENGKATAVVPEGLALRDMNEKLMLKTHHYSTQASALTFSQPGRFKRLITEITTLQTGLPPGVFVRYCENRPDILKCVIIGPVGTPYENGLFEFDLFCGANFPNVPPHVNFKGTERGCANINPNLYADGKVCLSLLGTWSGEPWKPEQSTLLQVLISIQAMILCEEPWYNEPGREAGYTRSTTGPSAIYNRKIREYTVRAAILAWLNEPPPLWDDVVDYHFKQQGNTILKIVEEWAKNADEAKKTSTGRAMPLAEYYDYDDAFADAMAARGRALNSSDMGTMLSTLQNGLKRYGATFKVEYVAPPPEKRTAPSGSFASHSSQSQPPSWVSLANSSAAPPGFPAASHYFHESHDMPESMSFFQHIVAARGGHNQGHSPGRGGFGRGQTATYSNWSETGSSSQAPRYDLRSSTLGRGSGGDPSTRGGRGGFLPIPPPPPPPFNGNMNIGLGRGGLQGESILSRGGFGRGHGRGQGNAAWSHGLSPEFPPLPTGSDSFGRGRGGAFSGDPLSIGDAPPWNRGGFHGRGRGGEHGGRGGRGRGRGRGDRGSSGS
jgi:ubiquitin-protein ligase